MVGPVVFFGRPSLIRALAAAACAGSCLLPALAAGQAAPAPAPAPAPPALVIRAHDDDSGSAAGSTTPAATKPAPAAPGVQANRRPPRVAMAPPDVDAAPSHQRPIRVALTSGYGLDLDPAVTGVNPFGVSFGVLGGYTIGSVYLGTRFLFFVGEARVLDDGTEQSADEWLLGFEGGYGFRAGPLVLRPELGFGLAISSSEAARAARADPNMPVPIDTSSEDPYLELGVVLECDLSRRLLIGVEARSTAVLGKATATSDAELFALVVLGTLGVRF